MSKTTALIFVEGETEEEFYQVVCDRYLRGLSKQVKNLHGNFNIHSKILDKTVSFLENHPESEVRVYCCIDRESRDQNPPINIDNLVKTFALKKCRVLSVRKIIATQMIESWFFHDTEGIYKFLSTPKSKRNYKFKPPEKFTHIHLADLFKRNGKIYIKGKRCKNFIKHLDIKKIVGACEELQKGINLISRKKQPPKMKKIKSKK